MIDSLIVLPLTKQKSRIFLDNQFSYYSSRICSNKNSIFLICSLLRQNSFLSSIDTILFLIKIIKICYSFSLLILSLKELWILSNLTGFLSRRNSAISLNNSFQQKKAMIPTISIYIYKFIMSQSEQQIDGYPLEFHRLSQDNLFPINIENE